MVSDSAIITHSSNMMKANQEIKLKVPSLKYDKRKSTIKSIILLLFCLLLIMIALINHYYVPKKLEALILNEFALNPQSASYKSWQKTSIPIYNYYYLFNITNANELFQNNGKVKPQLREIGPFVFKLQLEKTNISWNFDNDTVAYRQRKTWIPVPSKTIGSLDDEIVHLNIPLLSGIHQISHIPEDEQFLAYESLNSLIDVFNMSFIMKHKIRHLLFEGYDDDLLNTASSLYPTEVPQTRFGWLYNKNQTSSDGIFRVYTGRSDSAMKLGYINTWNYENENIKWKSGKCRSFDRTTTGDLQPPFYKNNDYKLLKYFGQNDLLRPSPNIRMFIADMCRSFDLEYYDEIKRDDNIRRYRYRLGQNIFNYSINDNRCYCRYDNCPPNGLYDLGICAKDSPIFVSNPHFLFGDQSLIDHVEGLQPDINKHLFNMEFDDKFGIAMNVNIKFQLNAMTRKTDAIELMSDWPDDMQLYIPQLWFHTHAELSEMITNQLYFLTNILPLILLLITILLSLLAIVCCIFLVINIISSRIMSYTLDDNDNIAKYESVSMLETKSDSDD